MRRIEDITASTVSGVEQNVDVPFRAFECMCAGLAYYLSKKRNSTLLLSIFGNSISVFL